jgi:hypothetical protein
MVELFFFAHKQLLFASSSNISHRHIPGHYSGLAPVQTLDRNAEPLDLPASYLVDALFPHYIVNELSTLLCNILEGQRGPHINDIVQQLTVTPVTCRTQVECLEPKRCELSRRRTEFCSHWTFPTDVFFLCLSMTLIVFFFHIL